MRKCIGKRPIEEMWMPGCDAWRRSLDSLKKTPRTSLERFLNTGWKLHSPRQNWSLDRSKFLLRRIEELILGRDLQEIGSYKMILLSPTWIKLLYSRLDAGRNSHSRSTKMGPISDYLRKCESGCWRVQSKFFGMSGREAWIVQERRLQRR